MTDFRVKFKIDNSMIVTADSASEAVTTAYDILKDTCSDICCDEMDDADVPFELGEVTEIDPETPEDDEEIAADDVMPTISGAIDALDLDDLETTDDGQLIIYADIYKWSDGSYHTTKEE
jgi:hypothetical protein